MKICFATNNKNKIKEVRSLLPESMTLLSLEDIGCLEELPETHNTLEENSMEKATYVFEKYGVPCFADDSGLEVNALNGEPGAHSAMYAGSQRSDDDNMNLLLAKLEGQIDRQACFRTIITLMGWEKEPVVFEGRINGTIQESKKGNNGFGYDPLFVPDGHTVTFAEMSSESKNAISHRAIATNKLATYLSSENNPKPGTI
jgi:XTP/dITP diphosphohydrolase